MRLENDLNAIHIEGLEVWLSLFADDKIFDIETLKTPSTHS
jgi:hypothetical protein